MKQFLKFLLQPRKYYKAFKLLANANAVHTEQLQYLSQAITPALDTRTLLHTEAFTQDLISENLIDPNVIIFLDVSRKYRSYKISDISNYYTSFHKI